MKISDKCIIELKAGDGGNGVVSWRREANLQNGGPWGGNGGKGGDIIIVGDHNENTLNNFRYTKKISAKDGENGKTKLCHGKNGDDCIVKVPIGTSIVNFENNNEIVDILKSGQEFLICKGGNGGRGNAHFVSSFNKAPTLFENGNLGEKLKVILNLKYIADVGIIGLPNAGKSTFINQISNANSKTDNYKFTTLIPVLGVVDHNDQKLVFADIPGLIEGASEGIGLGHEFLKHIERCNFLIHIISMNSLDNEDPYKSYKIINLELKKYKNELIRKKIYIVANKIDLEDSKKNLTKFKKHFKNDKLYIISGLLKTNINELIDDIFSEYEKYKKQWDDEIKNKISSFSLVKLEKEEKEDLIIEKKDSNSWTVSSNLIDYWFQKIPQTTPDNIVRFHQKIKLEELEKKLKKQGAKINDSFYICGMEYVIE